MDLAIDVDERRPDRTVSVVPLHLAGTAAAPGRDGRCTWPGRPLHLAGTADELVGPFEED